MKIWLLCVFAASLSFGAPKYSVTSLPLGPLNSPKINDKGQVIGVEGDKTVKLYLPAPDYSFVTAGVHTILLPPEVTRVRFTDYNNHSNTIGQISSTATFDRWFYSLDGTTYTTLNDVEPRKINDQARILGFDSTGTTIIYEGLRTRYRDILDHSPLHTVSMVPSNSPAATIPNSAIAFVMRDINSAGRMAGNREDPLWVGRRISTASTVTNGVYNYIDAGPGEPVLNPSDFGSPSRKVSHRPLTMLQNGSPEILPGFPDLVADFPGPPEYDVYGLEALEISYSQAINNRNEVFGLIANTGEGWVHTRPWIYLPAAAYGLPAGLNILDDFYYANLTAVTVDSFGFTLTDSGDLFAPKGTISNPTQPWTEPYYPDFTHWRRGEIFNVAENLLTPGQTVTLTDWHDINNKGVILATGFVDGGEPTLMLLTPNGGTEIVVNSTGNKGRDSSVVGSYTGDTISNGDPETTLRSAIEALNAGIGQKITFDIPGVSGLPTIPLLSPLPAITVPVEIDATTQASGLVEVRGNGGAFHGLDLQGGASKVTGLIISGFSGQGMSAIKLSEKGGNEVYGNYIGVDKTATEVVATPIGILIDDSAANQIGSAKPEDQNVIAAIIGILVQGENADNNSILNNRIGLSPTGTHLPTDLGIGVTAGKSIAIGTAGAGNKILGEIAGVSIEAISPVEILSIEANELGLLADGKNVADQSIGIRVGGIAGSYVKNFSIKDNKIAGYSANLLVFDPSTQDGTISGNRIGLQFGEIQQRPANLEPGAQAYGARISGASNITLENNTIAGHKWNVLLAGTQQFTTNSNGTESFRDPFTQLSPAEGVAPAKNVTVRNNKIGINDAGEIPANSTYLAGISIYGHIEDVVIEGNTISKHDSESPKSGILIVNGKNHRISGNIIGTTAGSAITTAVGISILGGSNFQIGEYAEGSGNVIGHNRIGIVVAGDGTGLQFKGNTIGTDAPGSGEFGNTIGMLINETGEPEGEKPAVLVEENTFANNETAGLQINNTHLVTLLNNHIGLTEQLVPLPNGIGIDVGSSLVLIEGNTIAKNTNKGINLSGTGFANITENKIYENGDDSGIAGIVYASPPHPAPKQVAALREPPDDAGNVSVWLVVKAPERDETVTYEFFTDGEFENPQGRNFVFSRTAYGGDDYFENVVVPPNHPLAKAESVTATLTLATKVTTAFSLKSTVVDFEIPSLDFYPAEPNQLNIGWLKTDLFKLQEALNPGGPWFDSQAVPQPEGSREFVTIPLSLNAQFFRLIFDPAEFLD